MRGRSLFTFRVVHYLVCLIAANGKGAVMKAEPFSSKRLRVSAFQRWAWILAVIILAGTSYWLAEILVVRGATQASGGITPFTLTIDLYDFSQDSLGVLVGHKVVARRSDGSTDEIVPFLGKMGARFGLKIRHLDLADGRRMEIVDDIKARSTFPPQNASDLAEHLGHLEHPPQNCLNSRDKLEGTSTILGENVDVIQWPQVAGHTITEWADPRIGCEIIRYQIQERQSDGSMKVTFAGKTGLLTFGEPDSALFDPKPGYSEMLPSHVIQAEIARMGGQMNDSIIKEGQRSDEIYLGHLPHR